jgi:hypothetical protein
MLASTFLTIALLATPILAVFQFTAPEPGTALNLSAPSIEIAWIYNDGIYPLFDLWFNAKVNGFSWALAENISLADSPGRYTWNPADILESLEANNNTLSDGKDFVFEARMKGEDGGATMPSEAYSVTGYEHVGAAAGLQPRVWAALLVVVLMSVAFGL